MGTIISKDTRRISFDNTISTNPILIQKSTNDSDDIDIDDFNENRSHHLNFKENIKYTKMHDEEQDYWSQRIDHLKNEHQIINTIIENEYEKTIEKADKLFESPNITKERIKYLKPCIDLRTKLLQCYEESPRQPLLCSEVVQEFTKCVTTCQLMD